MDINRIVLVIKRSFTLTFRGLDPLTDFFYWPLYDIIIWGFALTWVSKSTLDPRTTLVVLTSLVLWQAVSRVTLDITFNFLSEMWARNILNLFVTPLTLGEWMASVMTSGALTSLFGVCVGTAAVWLLYGINILATGPFLLLILLLLIASGWTVGFLGTCFLVLYGHRAQKVVWIAAWFFGPYIGVFYPIEQMPVWAQVIGYSVPMTYLFQCLRNYILTGVIIWSQIFFAIGMGAVYLIASMLFLKYCFEKTRRGGLAQLEGA